MPEQFVPNENQYAGLSFGMQNSFGAYFWDPGTRKTSTFLMLYNLLRDAGYVNRMLVTSTKNIVTDVWPDEIEKWKDLDLTYAMLAGGGERRRRNAFDLDADVYLINNTNIPWLVDTYGVRTKGVFGGRAIPGIDMLVVDDADEGYRRRNTYFKALKKALHGFKRRYLGTGTPMPHGYEDLWPLMYLVDRGRALGDNITAYHIRYFLPGGYEGKVWSIREGADIEIQTAIEHLVHRVEKDLDVVMHWDDRWVDLPPKARAAYDELEEEFITEWRGRTLLAANSAVATGKLRQAANGAIYHDREGNWVELHREKVNALKQILHELDGEPLLVAYEFEHDYEMLVKHGLKFPSYSRAKGPARTALKDAWNRRELPCLTGQIQAMSHGLNAQSGGHHLAYYGLTYDLAKFVQFFQRLWRDGQKHDVVGYRIGARNTADEVMMGVLNTRDRGQKDFLGAMQHDQKRFVDALNRRLSVD